MKQRNIIQLFHNDSRVLESPLGVQSVTHA